MDLAPENPAGFPATHWTLIATASGPERDSALSRLYQTYWAPICAQARRFGVPEAEAEDVAQELFIHLFHSGAMARADRSRGRFRSYLLGALRNHLAHRRARALTQKRGGAFALVSLDSAEFMEVPPQAPVDARDFDAEWARALLGEALRRFRHEETHHPEARASFDVLGGVALGEAELSCEDAAQSLSITVPAVKSRVFRLRRRFHDLVREEVRRTVSSEADCDEELCHLGAVIEKGGGVPDIGFARTESAAPQ